MTNEFTLENTKDATHVCFSERGIQFANNNGYINDVIDCMNNREHSLSGEHDTCVYDLDLNDQTDRGYPTLEWFLKCGYKLEVGDEINPGCGPSQALDADHCTLLNEPSHAYSWLYVKSTHDNRRDLTAMARNEYYSKREKQWPTEEESARMIPIGQNGNNGEHYPDESESPLSPNFESFTSGQEFFIAQINTLAGLPSQRYYVKQFWCNSGYQREYVELGIAFDNKSDAERKCKELLNIDTRTDKEKLRDALVKQLTSKGDMHNQFAAARDAVGWLMESNKFTITLNEEG